MLSVVACPKCGGIYEIDQTITIKSNIIKTVNGSKRKTELIDIAINDISDSGDKVRHVLAGIRSSLRDGVLIDDLVDQLRVEYGLARSYALVIIEKIKEFYQMYSPDTKRLCFIL